MEPEHYDNLIRISQKTINTCRNICRLILVVGGIIFFVSAVVVYISFSKSDGIKESMVPIMVSLFGIFTGALGTLPYKEIPPQESKIARYEAIKIEIEKLADLPDEERTTKIKLIADLFKAID